MVRKLTALFIAGRSCEHKTSDKVSRRDHLAARPLQFANSHSCSEMLQRGVER